MYRIVVVFEKKNCKKKNVIKIKRVEKWKISTFKKNDILDFLIKSWFKYFTI